MNGKLFTDRLNQIAQAAGETNGWDAQTFRHILDQFHQPLHRYFAVHTGGNLTRAQHMTTETFSILYRKPNPLAKQSFPSWLFEIAWDVLNAHWSCRAGDVQADVDLADDRPLIVRTLRTLRAVAFYPRKTLYLRFFAELDLQDIVLMMDKSEVAVKNFL